MSDNSRVLRACWHCDRDVGKQDDLENWGLARYSTTQALHQLLIIHKHDWNVFFLFFVLVWRGKKVRLQSSPGIFTMVEALNSILLKSPDCLWVSLFFFFFFKYHDVNGVTIKDAHWQQVLFTILFASPREHSLLASPYTVITCARDCNLKCIKVSLKCSYTWRVRWDVGRFGDEKQGKPGFIPHVCLHVFCLFVFVFLQRLGDAAEPHHDANGAVRGR